jgi:heat shock protein HtpX
MYIMNPLTGAGMDNLFSTHPNVENRVAALQQLAQQMGLRPAQSSSFLSGGGVSQAARGPWGRR